MKELESCVQALTQLNTTWTVIIYGSVLILLVLYFKVTGKRVKELESMLSVLRSRLTPVMQLLATLATLLGKIYAKKGERSMDKDE